MPREEPSSVYHGLDAAGAVDLRTPPEGAEKSISARLRSGVSWSLLGALINSGMNLLVSVALARTLGTDGFGKFAITQSTMVAVGGIAQLATGYTANKYVAEFHSVDPAKTGRIIGFCALISFATALLALLGVLASAPWLASNMLGRPELAAYLMTASGLVFFSVLNGYQIGAMAGLEAYRRMAQSLAAAAILNFVFCVGGAFLWGLYGAVLGLSAGSFLQWLCFRYVLNHEMRQQRITAIYRNLEDVRAIFVRFALPAAMSGFVSMPAIWLANSFLIKEANGVGQMALFAAAGTLRSLVLFMPLILNRVTTTLLNNQRGLSDPHRYRAVFRLNFFTTAAMAITAATCIAIVGPWLLKVYGNDFTGGYPVLLILLVGAALEVIFGALYQLLQSNELMWHSLFWIVIPRDVTLVILAFYLAPAWGGRGLAWSYGISWLTAVTLVTAVTLRAGLLPRAKGGNSMSAVLS